MQYTIHILYTVYYSTLYVTNKILTTTVQCTALDSNLPNSRAHIPVCVHLNLEYPEHKRVRLCSILPNTESDSAVSFLPQIEILQYPAHHRVRLCSVLPTTESDSAVSFLSQSLTLQYSAQCPPRSQFLQYPARHGVRLCSILATVSQTLQCPAHHKD